MDGIRGHPRFPRSLWQLLGFAQCLITIVSVSSSELKFYTNYEAPVPILEFYQGQLDGKEHFLSSIPVSAMFAKTRFYQVVSSNTFILSNLSNYYQMPAITPNFLTTEMVPVDVSERCVKATTEKECVMPSPCKSMMQSEMEHSWYGATVTYCVAHDIKKSDIQVQLQYKVAQQLFHKETYAVYSGAYDQTKFIFHWDTSFTGLITPDGAGFVPVEYIQRLGLTKNLLALTDPKGDWHVVNYKYYPMFTWHKVFYENIDNVFEFVPAQLRFRGKFFKFRFKCGPGAPDPAAPLPYYSKQDCGELIPVSENTSYCRNALVSYSPNRCPLDYLPRKSPIPLLTKFIHIDTTKEGFCTRCSVLC